MEINLDDLRLIINKIFDRLALENCKTIELRKDDYWDVSDEDKYDLYKRPNNLYSGKLSDDLEFLLPILSDKDQATQYMFVHVAPLLKYIADSKLLDSESP